MYITKKSVNRHIIRPLKKIGYDILLVGGISKKAYSRNDIDILVNLPKYPKADKVFKNFKKDLKKLKWNYVDSFYCEKYGISHVWNIKNKIVLDIFINEG